MTAAETMLHLNPDALHSREGGKDVFVEDIRDSDGRWYRVEYRCNTDGSEANAWLQHNPWGDNPYDYYQAHMSSEGFLCLGPDADRTHSPYGLEYVVQRARFWCTGYSYLRENGYACACRDIPGW